MLKESFIEKNLSKEKSRKRLLYIHGLSSSGMSATAGTLRKLLPEYEVLSPDLPVNPQEAFSMLKEL